jgi:hypothetical protein
MFLWQFSSPQVAEPACSTEKFRISPIEFPLYQSNCPNDAGTIKDLTTMNNNITVTTNIIARFKWVCIVSLTELF